jgi:NADPH:quinone reductase-like Zn-dependent oxidoreductase
MRAATFSEYGGDVEIAEVPTPELLADSVLIEVHAASVNPIDSIVRAGYLQGTLELQLPATLGFDVSGVVVECGSEVTQFQPSDEVYGRAATTQAGTIAEFTMVNAGDLARKPTTISHVEAAAIPLAGLTAWEGLISEGELQDGQKVLIHAGSGGVGTFAIQIAKHFGAFVATTTSADNEALVSELGADVVVDYRTQQFEDELKDYDLVLDMLGGETLLRSFQVLKSGGTLISIKGSPPEGVAEEHNVTFKGFLMWPSGEILGEIGKLVDQGVIRPVVDKIYPFAEVQEAYDYSGSGRAKGKIVVAIKE